MTTGKTVVYVASARANEIAAFVLDQERGALALVQRVAVTDSVACLAIRPDRRFLYAGLRGETASAAAFAIEASTGKLQLAGIAAFGDPAVYLSTDVSGRYLMSASYSHASFTIGMIGADGSLDAATINVRPTPPHAHCTVTDPQNRYLFVSSLGGDVILQFVFDAASGRLVPNHVPFVATASGSGPRHLVFHPSGDVVYVNGELDGSVSAYAFEAQTGRLREPQRAFAIEDAANVTPWGADLAVAPDGRRLYASERRTSTLAIFDLEENGRALHRRAIVSTEEQPRSFAIDPSGRYLVVAGEKSNYICIYAIDPVTGVLDARERYEVGEKPTWVSITTLSEDVNS